MIRHPVHKRKFINVSENFEISHQFTELVPQEKKINKRKSFF